MIEVHPIALKIPPMSVEEYTAFRDDIAKNGLLSPITLFEGKKLDGIHRDRACRELGIEPRYETYEGSDPLGFVLSKNMHRRNLTDQQRRELAKLYVKEHPEKSDRALAEVTPVSRDTIAAIRQEIAEETVDANVDGRHYEAPAGEPPDVAGAIFTAETGEPPPRIERGLKKDGTPRKARGRKPGTAAVPQVPAEPVPAESEHEDHTHLMSRRDLWIVETTWIFSEHLDDALHAIVTIISDRKDEIAKIHEIKRQGLVRSFAYALGLKIAD